MSRLFFCFFKETFILHVSSAACLCSPACTVQPPFPTRWYTLKNSTGCLLSKCFKFHVPQQAVRCSQQWSIVCFPQKCLKTRERVWKRKPFSWKCRHTADCQVILLGCFFFLHMHTGSLNVVFWPLWEACLRGVKKESAVQTCSPTANLCRISHCCFWKENYWGPFWEASSLAITHKSAPNTY